MTATITWSGKAAAPVPVTAVDKLYVELVGFGKEEN